MKSRPTPANLYTTRRIGLKHYKDPESKTLFSQGKYPTKLTYKDLPSCFLSGTYYGARGLSPYGFYQRSMVQALLSHQSHV